MNPRPVPLCHRTIGQQKPRHDIEAPWLNAYDLAENCMGSLCSLHVRVRSATDPEVALMRCAENAHGEPWLDPNAPQPARREVTE